MPVPASVLDRIAMMVLFAEDLQLLLQSSKSSSRNLQTSHTSTLVDSKEEMGKEQEQESELSIDIALTTAPYYTDKSLAISSAEPPPYPSFPTHIYLLGYDTLTRFLAPKYYPSFTPPLSALSPFFDSGHKLLVLLRPSSSPSKPSSSSVSTDTEEEEQRTYITSLSRGSLQTLGFKPHWSKQIDILEGNGVAKASGISSTNIRKAAKDEEWEKVGEMCTEGVAAWIRERGLYGEDG